MTLLDEPRWKVLPFDPERDLAPADYRAVGLDVERSCDGGERQLRTWKRARNVLRGQRILNATGTPASRGWGRGWPECQYGKWVTISRSDGLRLSVRRERAELTILLLDETERLGYDLKPGQCWGAACRSIRGSDEPSNHSWALADDLNSLENPMGSRNGRIRQFPKVIALWKRYGYRWGGDYAGRPDDMHFEYMGTPQQLIEHTMRARAELGQEDELMAIFRDREDAKKAFREVLDEEPKGVKATGFRGLIWKALFKATSTHPTWPYEEHIHVLEREIARQGRVQAALCKTNGVELDNDGEPVSTD